MKTVVLCFGNEFLDKDRLPLNLCEELREKIPNVEFVSCEEPNRIIDYIDYDKIFILDTVKNIKNVSLIENLDILKERKISTLHDFDLGFFLKIFNKIRKLDNVKIIGIPMNFDKNLTKRKIKEILNEFNL